MKKKRLKQLIVGIVLAIVAIAVGSCDRLPNFSSNRFNNDWTEEDSATVIALIQEALSPEMSSVGEVFSNRNTILDDNNVLKTFISLPDEVLESVAKVTLNKEGYATRRAIVYEYVNNKDVYDNLVNKDSTSIATNPTPEQQNTSTASMEGVPGDIATEISYHYEIDTVNGKPVKRLVEERRYESK